MMGEIETPEYLGRVLEGFPIELGVITVLSRSCILDPDAMVRRSSYDALSKCLKKHITDLDDLNVYISNNQIFLRLSCGEEERVFYVCDI